MSRSTKHGDSQTPPGVDAGSLESGLKSGGAGGLVEAVRAMQATAQTEEDAAQITKDENGQPMYDFRSHPQREADRVQKVGALRVSGQVRPMYSGGAGVQALADGLNAVKQSVDELVQNAHVAMGGQLVPSAGTARPAPAQAQAGISAGLRKDLHDLFPRVRALERQSKKLQGEVRQVIAPSRVGSASGVKDVTEKIRDSDRLGEQDYQIHMQLQGQAAQLRAVRTIRNIEVEQLDKAEEEHNLLKREVKALVKLEGQWWRNARKKLKHKRSRAAD